VFVDVFDREIDLVRRLVDVEHLRDDRLSLADVVADVLDPAGGDLADVTEAALVLVLVEVDEDAEVGDPSTSPTTNSPGSGQPLYFIRGW